MKPYIKEERTLYRKLRLVLNRYIKWKVKCKSLEGLCLTILLIERDIILEYGIEIP
jgi:hypothetical protein